MTLQENLDSLKNQKLPSKTTLGDLQGMVPVPYSKFDTVESPRRNKLAKFYFHDDDYYRQCEFDKCGFFGTTAERQAHARNVHIPEHDCKASSDSGCKGCEDIQNFLNQD